MSASRGERGFVLVIVLGVLVLLTVLTLGFARRALLERRAAVLTADREVALSLARGAVERGIADLRNRTVMEELGQVKPNTGQKASWLEHEDLVAEDLYSSDFFATEEDGANYVIEDLDGRISLNAADEALLDEVEALDFTAVNDILERREENDDGLKGLFLATEEILTLEGVDEDDWYGEDGKPGLRDIFTAWGEARINANTAPAAVLECIPDVDPSTVEAIVAHRQGNDGLLNTADDRFFKDFGELQQRTGIALEQVTALQRYCKLNSRFFTITGFATRRQGKIKASCTAVVEIQKEKVAVLQWREGPIGS